MHKLCCMTRCLNPFSHCTGIVTELSKCAEENCQGRQKIFRSSELSVATNSRRDYRGTRSALFDGIKEGGIRASQYSSNNISEHDNDVAIEGLKTVNILKRLTGDIHEEVESHNRLLDRMGKDMDSSRGILSRTVDRFKLVFETKSSHRTPSLCLLRRSCSSIS